MANVPKRVGDRLSSTIKRFQPIIASAKTRDVNESDTVTIVTDMLAEAFGYDKYSEITSEHSIKSTFCDLAVKIEGATQLLVEVKAIGLELKDSYVKQAVDYAANLGIDWVVLTNAEQWRIYKVTFAKPIDQELVCEFNFTQLEPKNESSLEMLYTLTKEGWQKSALGELHERKQALSRFFLAAILISDPVVNVIRRELKRLSPDVRIEIDEIRNAMAQDVIKREVLEGEKADVARKQVNRAANRALRAKSNEKDGTNEPTSEAGSNGAPPVPPPSITEEVRVVAQSDESTEPPR